MTWGAIAAAAVSVGAGAASSAIKNSSAKGGEMGYDLPMMTNSPYDANNMQLMAQMGQQGAINSEAGRLPPGMEVSLDKIKKRQLAESQREMYGDPGQRGGSIMDSAMSAGAMSGVGPKALNKAIVPRALNDYASRNSQIMNYIDSLKFSGLQKARTESFNQMKGMPRSNELPYTGQAINMSTPGQPGMDTGLQNVDWNSMLGNLDYNTNAGIKRQYADLKGREANTVIPMRLGGQGPKGQLLGYDTEKDYYPPAR